MPVLVVNADVQTCLWKSAIGYLATHNASDADILGITLCNSVGILPGGFDAGRGELSFDTSPMGVGAVATAGELELWLARPTHDSEDDPGQTELHIVEGVNTGDPVVADYGLLLPKIVVGNAGVAYATVLRPPGSYHTITLNAIALTWINPSGMTTFGLRIQGDIDGVEPTGLNDVYASRARVAVLTVTYNEARVRRFRGNINIDQLIYQHTERMVR